MTVESWITIVRLAAVVTYFVLDVLASAGIPLHLRLGIFIKINRFAESKLLRLNVREDI